MKLTKHFWIPAGVGVGMLALGAGVTAGIVLPKALEAKNGLKNFISDGGSYNSIANKDKINIVALGDSETAGYNGYMGKDYVSYADFLASSFKNVNKLGNYSQFAKSGERLSDIKREVFENAELMRRISGEKDKNGKTIKGTSADIITITIGANDVIAYLKLLHLPFYKALSMLSPEKTQTKPNGNLNKIGEINYQGFNISDQSDKKYPVLLNKDPEKSRFFLKNESDPQVIKYWENEMNNLSEIKDNVSAYADSVRTKIFGRNPGLTLSKTDSYEQFHESLIDLKELLEGDNSEFLHLDKDWYPRIFDLVKREMSVLIRDLHEANPNAQIIVLGHAFPFVQFDKNAIDSPHSELDNKSLGELFRELLKTMDEGANLNISSSKNKFVSFYSVDELQVDEKHKFKDYIKPINLKDVHSFKESASDNAMPNIGDIHPSTFGHEKIGEALFRMLGKESGLTNKEIEDNYQKSYEPTPGNMNDEKKKNWIRKDEDGSDAKWKERMEAAEGFHAFTNISSMIPEAFKPIVKQFMDEILFNNDDSLITEKNLKESLNKIDVTLLPNAIQNMLTNNLTLGELLMGPIKTMIPEIGDLNNHIIELANIRKVIDKELYRGMHTEAVKDIYQFKVSDWGLKKVFEIFNKVKIDLSNITKKLKSLGI